MVAKQLTVFIENRTGRLSEVLSVLKHSNVSILSMSLADTTEYGLLRLIVPDVDKAVEVLHAASFAVMVTDVLCISCPNVPGALSSVLEKLASNDIFIEYMYAFSDGDSANVIIRPTDVEAAVKVLG